MKGNWSLESCLMTVTCMCVMALCGMAQAIHAPFYPAAANHAGWSVSVAGLVFGFFEICCLFSTIPAAYLMARIGSKLTLLLGVVLTGGSMILFSFLAWIHESHSFYFLMYSFILRFLQAIGTTGANMAIILTVAGAYPHKASTMIAWTESMNGLGNVMGPGIGGVLYDLGGFIIPFMIIGLMLLFFLVPAYLYIQDDTVHAPGNHSDEMFPVTAVLRVPAIWVPVLTSAIGIGLSAYGFITSTLEPHLRQFHLPGKVFGAIFLLDSLAYTGLSPFWGSLCDKKVPPIKLMMAGALIETVALLLIGPLPWFPISPSVWLSALAMTLVGLGMGLQSIPSLALLKEICSDEGFPDSTHMKGLISGIWLGSFSFGAILGLIGGGFLFDAFGFRMETVAFMFISLGSLFMLFFYYVFKKRRRPSLASLSVYKPLLINVNGIEKKKSLLC